MPAKLTEEDFYTRAVEKHKDRYDYSNVVWVSANSHVDIICRVHGVFSQKAQSHLQGQGCRKCAYNERELERASPENWYRQALEFMDKLHKDKPQIHFDLLSFRGSKRKIQYHCNIHNEGGYVNAAAVLKSLGCPKCSNEKSIHNDEDFCREKHAKFFKEFLVKAELLHGDKYDYSKSEYVCSRTKMLIKCKSDGTEFTQRPSAHLQGQGCPKCGYIAAGINTTKDQEVYKKSLQDPSIDKTLDLVSYAGMHKNCSFWCNIHNKETVITGSAAVLRDIICNSCKREDRLAKSNERFITEAVKRHGDKFDYSLCIGKYKTNRTSLKIRCTVHDKVFTTTANRHLVGAGGCPECARMMYGRWSPKVLLKNKEYFENEPCVLYFIKMWNDTGSWHKIGISKNLNSRLGQIASESGCNVELLHTFESNTMSCSKIEHKLQNKYKQFRFTSDIYFGGYTECFMFEDTHIKDIINFLNKTPS